VAVVADQVIDRADIDAGRLTFTPAPNESGPAYANIGFSASDGIVDSGVARLTIDVLADNIAPVAQDGRVEVVEDTARVMTAADFGFDDGDGDALALVRVMGIGGSGSLTLDGAEILVGQIVDRTALDAGLLLYTPAADASGPDQARIDFRVGDGEAESNTAVVVVDVAAVEDAPRPVADAFDTDEDSTLEVAAAQGVLANDVDPDPGDTLTVVEIASGGLSAAPGSSMQGSDGGTFVLNEDGSLAFDPGQDFNDLPAGAEKVTSIDYVVADATGQMVRIPVTVTVAGVNDAAVAGDDSGSTSGDSVLSVGAANGLLLNDADPDIPDTIAVVSVSNGGDSVGTGVAITGSAGGRFTVFPDGSYLFDPADLTSLANGSQQTTAVTYTIADENGATTTAVLSVSVIGTAQPDTTTPDPAPSEPEPTPSPTPAAPPVSPTPGGGEAEPPTNESENDDGTNTPGESSDGSSSEGASDSTDSGVDPRQLQLALLLEEEFSTGLAAFGADGLGLRDGTGGAGRVSSIAAAALAALRGDASFESLDPRLEILDGTVRDGLIALGDPLLLLTSPDYHDSLDAAQALATATTNDAEVPVLAGSLTLTTGVSVAYVLWLVRSGVIVSSVLSAMPLWRLVDPLPVLASLGSDEDDGESIEDIVAGSGDADTVAESGDTDADPGTPADPKDEEGVAP
jgi:VCBS repeat-containing protein